MEFKSYADILALHTEFAHSFEKRRETLRDELPKSFNGLIAVKRAALKQAQEAGAAAERARKDVMKRLDTELGRHRTEVTRLTQEIAEIEASVKGAKDVKPAKTTKPAKPAKPVK